MRTPVLSALFLLVCLGGCRSEALTPSDEGKNTSHGPTTPCADRSANTCETDGLCEAATCCDVFTGCYAKGKAPQCVADCVLAPCDTITETTTCNARPDCHAVTSGELPCASPSCSDHFVRCADGVAICDGSTQMCTGGGGECPSTATCLPGHVRAYADLHSCCTEGCVAASKCDPLGGGE